MKKDDSQEGTEGTVERQLNSSEKKNVAKWLESDFKLGLKQKTSNRKRAKNYTFVLYPDSLPNDFFERFQKLGYKMVLSPVHDRDVNSDGELKKAHYHLLMMGSGSWINFKDLQDFVSNELDGKGVAVPERVANIEGLVRYLVHLDNPEKFQYSQSDIRIYGNVDLTKYFKFSEDSKLEILSSIIQFIEENDIIEFYDLLNYANENDYIWFKYLNSNTYVIDKYLTSKRNCREKKDGNNENNFVGFLLDKKQK